MTHTARLAVQASTPDSKRRSWIEVMPVGKERRNGRWFFTITRDDLDVYASHIRANADTIPVDYDHAEAGTKAAGWFTGQADVRGDGTSARLWAEVEWTPQAAEAIRSGEYRFISPEFTFHEKDQKTGLMTKAKELLAAALTNRPHFVELAPVTAVRGLTPTEGDIMQRPGVTLSGVALATRGAEILAAQGLDEPTDEDLVEAFAQAEAEGIVDDFDPLAVQAATAARVARQDEIHAKTVEILAGDGRELTHTLDEYLAAWARAERELGFAYDERTTR